jgi:hypothetical protein
MYCEYIGSVWANVFLNSVKIKHMQNSADNFTPFDIFLILNFIILSAYLFIVNGPANLTTPPLKSVPSTI